MNSTRSHIESFVHPTNSLGKRHTNLDEPMQPPYCVITYQSPQRRVAIYGINDRVYDYEWNARRTGLGVLYQGEDLEEAMAIFEAHERML